MVVEPSEVQHAIRASHLGLAGSSNPEQTEKFREDFCKLQAPGTRRGRSVPLGLTWALEMVARVCPVSLGDIASEARSVDLLRCCSL